MFWVFLKLKPVLNRLLSGLSVAHWWMEERQSVLDKGCVWATTSGLCIQQLLLRELHDCNSKGTAALFVWFCISLNKWLIRNCAKSCIQHKTGRCLVLLKCARDIYAERKRRCDRRKCCLLQRFGFLEPAKSSLTFVMESQALKRSSSFWEQEKIKICGYIDEATF